MKKIKLLLPLIFSLFCVITTFADAKLPPPNLSAQSLDGVAAIVNNGVITESELVSALSLAKKQLAHTHPQAINDPRLKQMLLQQLIDQKLLLQMAKHAKMKVTNAQLNQAITRIAKGNHLTIAKMKAVLKKQNTTFKAYQKQIRKQILIHQVQQSAVAGKVTVTPADIAKYTTLYKAQTLSRQKFHVVDILVPIAGGASAPAIATAKQKAEQIALRWKKGAKPAMLSPNHNTDLGWQSPNDLPNIFLSQLSHMRAGDIAGPIQAPNGFHIIKLLGVKGKAAKMPTKSQLRNMIFQIKFQKAAEKWIKGIRKTAYIKIMNTP